VSAVVQSTVNEDSSKDGHGREVKTLVIAKTNDFVPIPGGGYLTDGFGPVAENELGDVVFTANFYSIAEGGYEEGIFLWKADCDEIELIAATGDTLPNGNYLCGITEPNLNDLRYVVFQSDCETPNSGLTGTVYLVRPGSPIEELLAINAYAPGGRVTEINLGEPAINNEKLAATIDIGDDNPLTDDFEEVITKSFDPSSDDKDCPNGPCLRDLIKVCAAQEQDLGSNWTIDNIKDGVSISDGGLLAFAADIEGFENDYETTKTAVFTCEHGDLDVVQVERQLKPVGCQGEECKENTFGALHDVSNSDTGVVYVDYDNEPTGIFLSPAESDSSK
jgi:hypothetical protein